MAGQCTARFMGRFAVLSSAALALALLTGSSFGQTVTQTFDAGIPASWTIHDNFPIPGSPDFSAVPWTVNSLEGMANYTAGNPTLAATASSHNHPGQYDVSLITPTFAINAGVNGANINYDINLQRVDAFEFFDTNLSLNGGPWILMNRDTSSLGPAYSTGPPLVNRTISLSFFGAAVGDTARVEFRYFSTFLLPMVHNEYVEIDNVRTPTLVPEPAASGAVLLAAALATLRRKRS